MIALVVYFITYVVVVKFKKKIKLNNVKFPTLKMWSGGIFFHSKSEHKIKISNAKTIHMGNILYLKVQNRLVIISNIKDVKVYDGFLYFTGLGKVKILFDCKSYYRYFSIEIASKQFDLKNLKQKALENILNSNFDLNLCKIAKKYIKIIEKVLNIHIFKEKIVIYKNSFKLSYVLKYKLNNVIKQVVVNETI